MTPGSLIVYLGGIRSGKSKAAQEHFSRLLGSQGRQRPAYLGTLQSDAAPEDLELALRLTEHRANRPESWTTVEVGGDLLASGKACVSAGHDAWFLDGLGAWAALKLEQPQAAMAALGGFLALAKASGVLCVLVLDEVGQGGVPGHPVARAFADLNGSLNQAACGSADEVHWVQAGLAQRLK